MLAHPPMNLSSQFTQYCPLLDSLDPCGPIQNSLQMKDGLAQGLLKATAVDGGAAHSINCLSLVGTGR